MAAAGIGRSQRVRATLCHVCIDKDGVVFFCDVGEPEVLEVVGEADGAALPRHAVVVEGLETLQSGYVDLIDVRLSADDVLRVVVHEGTVVRASRW